MFFSLGSSRYPGSRGGAYGGGYRGGELPPGGYPPHGRNTFHPASGPRAPYHNPNYLGKPKNNKYYQHQLQMGMPPDMGYPEGYPEGYDGEGPPYHFMPNNRFTTSSYRFNKFHGEYAPFPGSGGPGGYNPSHKQQMGARGGQMSPGGADGKADAVEAGQDMIPLPPIVIDSELVAEVNSITSQMAAATAAGKEMTLTQAQQLTLQKHQLLVQQQKTQQQQAQQQLQVNPMLAKKFPNYRLLGRNIFEGNKNQPMPFNKQKRVKVNTYYSRFIKQHPTNNLPLAFQKTVNAGMAQDLDANKALEMEQAVAKAAKKIAKKKKKQAASESSSESASGSSRSRSSSSSRSSGSYSDSGSSTDGEVSKKKLKKKAKKEKMLKKAAAAGEGDQKSKVIYSIWYTKKRNVWNL